VPPDDVSILRSVLTGVPLECLPEGMAEESAVCQWCGWDCRLPIYTLRTPKKPGEVVYEDDLIRTENGRRFDIHREDCVTFARCLFGGRQE
jgi:hypothetical protein